MPAMPIGLLLVGMADTEHGGVVKRAAEDLQPKWQAVSAKTVTDLQGRLAGDIGGSEQVGSLPEGETPMRIETRGFALTCGNKYIVALVEGRHLHHHLPMLTYGPHIIIGGEEHRWQHTGAEVGTKISRPSDQVWLVNREDFRLSDDDLDVKIVLERAHATVLK